jgi:hypothetical protein
MTCNHIYRFDDEPTSHPLSQKEFEEMLDNEKRYKSISVHGRWIRNKEKAFSGEFNFIYKFLESGELTLCQNCKRAVYVKEKEKED